MHSKLNNELRRETDIIDRNIEWERKIITKKYLKEQEDMI